MGAAAAAAARPVRLSRLARVANIGNADARPERLNHELLQGFDRRHHLGKARQGGGHKRPSDTRTRHITGDQAAISQVGVAVQG
jgi:hypothetical protein